MFNNSDSIRVLVVDDDSAMRRSLKRVLTDNELVVETASGAAEAHVFLNARYFDVVLCDYEMPGQNGLEFLSELPDSHPELIRMVLSGQINGCEMAENWAYDIGIYEIFSKPIVAEIIASKIKFAVFKRQHAKLNAEKAENDEAKNQASRKANETVAAHETDQLLAK